MYCGWNGGARERSSNNRFRIKMHQLASTECRSKDVTMYIYRKWIDGVFCVKTLLTDFKVSGHVHRSNHGEPMYLRVISLPFESRAQTKNIRQLLLFNMSQRIYVVCKCNVTRTYLRSIANNTGFNGSWIKPHYCFDQSNWTGYVLR